MQDLQESGAAYDNINPFNMTGNTPKHSYLFRLKKFWS